MTATILKACFTLLGTCLAMPPAAVRDQGAVMTKSVVAVQHRRQTIYHSPESPGYTCWTGAWRMPDGSLMVCFTQATGPAKGRPRAAKEILDRLNWPPGGDARYDMTGLELRNVHVRSHDAGETWHVVSADPFRSPMNGVTGECETATREGTVIRGVWGFYLPFDRDVPRTGFLQHSTDGTRSWGKPEILLDPKTYTAWPKRIRQLRDGRLLITGGLARAGRQPDAGRIQPAIRAAPRGLGRPGKVLGPAARRGAGRPARELGGRGIRRRRATRGRPPLRVSAPRPGVHGSRGPLAGAPPETGHGLDTAESGPRSSLPQRTPRTAGDAGGRRAARGDHGHRLDRRCRRELASSRRPRQPLLSAKCPDP